MAVPSQDKSGATSAEDTHGLFSTRYQTAAALKPANSAAWPRVRAWHASESREVVDAFFDVSVRNIGIDSVVAVGMRNRTNLRPEKSRAAKRKQGPYIVAAPDDVDHLRDLHDR